MGFLNNLLKLNPHPTIENACITRIVPKCKEWKIDTLLITTRNRCPFCKPYNRKIYSLYGWNKKYPKIPDVLLKSKCPECGGSIGASIYFPDLHQTFAYPRHPGGTGKTVPAGASWESRLTPAFASFENDQNQLSVKVKVYVQCTAHTIVNGIDPPVSMKNVLSYHGQETRRGCHNIIAVLQYVSAGI